MTLSPALLCKGNEKIAKCREIEEERPWASVRQKSAYPHSAAETDPSLGPRIGLPVSDIEFTGLSGDHLILTAALSRPLERCRLFQYNAIMTGQSTRSVTLLICLVNCRHAKELICRASAT